MGITVIMITHEMAVIEAICDRVAIIDHSHIAESGKVSDIFSGAPNLISGRPADFCGDTSDQTKNFGGSRMIRVIFDGREASEPIIANMILACKAPVEYHACGYQEISRERLWGRCFCSFLRISWMQTGSAII